MPEPLHDSKQNVCLNTKPTKYSLSTLSQNYQRRVSETTLAIALSRSVVYVASPYSD